MKPKLLLGLALALGSVLLVGLFPIMKHSIEVYGLFGILFWLGMGFIIFPALGTVHWFCVWRKTLDREKKLNDLYFVYYVSGVVLAGLATIFIAFYCLISLLWGRN